MAHYLLQQEQQRREEVERQLYYTASSLEDVRRQLIDLQNAYQQQSAILEHERQQRAALVEQVKQQQAMLIEKERQHICNEKQRVNKQKQLMQRVAAEVKKFHAANKENATNDAYKYESLFAREISIVPSKIPAPAKYPHVDWSLDYSIARLEDMMEEPESMRNTLFYALLEFHCQRVEAWDVDSARCDELIKRVNEELFKNQS